MSDPLILDQLDSVLDSIPGARPLLSRSAHVELQWLPHAYIRDLVVRHSPPDTILVELALLIDDVGTQLAKLGPLRLSLAPAQDGYSPLLARIGLGESPSLALSDLRLALELDQPLLRRVAPDTGAPLAEPFRFEVAAALRVASDGTTDFQLFGVSIPAFTIANTGLIIELDDCQPTVGGGAVPLSLRALVSDEGGPPFSGLYARHALLEWLPQFRFPLGDRTGLRLNFRDVVIDDAGISFILDESWIVERANGKLTRNCQLLGSLFGGRFRIALESATGQVVQNAPDAIAVDGWIEIPALTTLLHCHCELTLDRGGNGAQIELSLAQDQGTTITLDLLGLGSLRVSGLALAGTLGNDSFTLNGSGQFNVVLPGWSTGTITADLAFTSASSGETLSIALPNVGLGPLGQLRRAELEVTTARADDGSTAITNFTLLATLAWRDLRQRLHLGILPPQIPQPPDDAQITASIAWSQSGLKLRVEAEAGDVTQILAFLPPAFRPEVRSCKFGFAAHYANPETFFATPSNSAIDGTAYARLSFKLALPPSLTDGGLIALHTADPDGFVDAEMSAVVHTSGATTVSLALQADLTTDISLPGVTHEPFVSVKLIKAKLDLSAGGGNPNRANIELDGSYELRPGAVNLPVRLSGPAAALLAPILNARLGGSVIATLALADDRAAISLTGTLDNAGFEFDLFDVVRKLSDGSPPTQGRNRQDLALEFDFGFTLEQMVISIGDLSQPPAASGKAPSSLSLLFKANIAAAELNVSAKLSTEEFVIGVQSDGIPLRLPDFAVRVSDLQAVTASTGNWTQTRFDSALSGWRDDLDGLADADDRDARAERGALQARIQIVEFIRQVWLLLGTGPRRQYQTAVTGLVQLLETASSLTHTNSNVKLVIGPAQLRVPFSDPRQTAVEGGAKLIGFAADDPLRALEGTTLKLGLSADQIYFALEGTGDPIPLPAFGRYQNGSVSLSELTIGYGFTRNSLAMSFAGALKWPDHLTEDADTSTRLGFGIKLPQFNRLSFRLDLTPIPGPIPVIPIFQFSLDLHTPNLPPLARTDVCTPTYDGLELRIPGLIHADLKSTALSPVFGILPVPNFSFDGDLDLGNEQFGLTVILDNLLVLMGIGTPPMPVPYIIDPTTPFFDHVCVNARFAGFGINFDVERPLPLPNPLLVFDVLGLIADPMRPIDSNGPLAAAIRIALTDAYISIPPWARRLIPGSNDLVRQEINVEINVGALIAAAQWLVRTGSAALDAAEQALAVGEQELQRLRTNPARFAVEDLLKILPPSLRVLDCEMSFAGFQAAAAIILTSPAEAAASSPRRLVVGRAPISISATEFVPRFTGPDLPLFAATTPAASAALWQLPAFQGFDRSDLNELPAPPRDAAAVLVAADVDLLDAISYRFLGYLADDGSFAMLTRVNVAPLKVTIAGITHVLPLKLEGRLRLSGRVTATARQAEVLAQGRGQWDIIPGVVQVAAGVDKPVELRLNSRGRFHIAGDGAIELFGPAGIRIHGALDASEAHLAVSGDLRFILGGTTRQPVLELVATGTARVGPGATWSYEGRGALNIFNLRFADVSTRLSGHEIALHMALKHQSWRVGNLRIDTHMCGEFDGLVRIPSDNLPDVKLLGRGSLELLGARLDGCIVLTTNASETSIRAEGELVWQQQRWFAARMAISSRGSAEFAGRTSVVLNLTPNQLPAGIEVASLFLRADLDGRLTFGRTGSLAHVDLKIDWSLGVRLPGGAPNQMFVLAMQKMHFDKSSLNEELMQIQGIRFVPLDDLVIPVPVLTSGGSLSLYEVFFDIFGVDQVPFLLTRDMVDFVEDDVDPNLIKSKTRIFDVPNITIENRSLGQLAADLAFRIRLRWKNDQLGFEIRQGIQQPQFIPIANLQ